MTLSEMYFEMKINVFILYAKLFCFVTDLLHIGDDGEVVEREVVIVRNGKKIVVPESMLDEELGDE